MENIHNLLIQGKFSILLPILREEIRKSILEPQDFHLKIPKLDFSHFKEEFFTPTEFTQYYFALCLWEARETEDDEESLASDVDLLEKSIFSQKNDEKVKFPIMVNLLILKSRPKATKDELHDCSLIIDQYLRQFPSTNDEEVRANYSTLVEILCLRVYVQLGLLESALSFLSKENLSSNNNNLMREDVRQRLEFLIREKMTLIANPQVPSPAMTVPSTSTATASNASSSSQVNAYNNNTGMLPPPTQLSAVVGTPPQQQQPIQTSEQLVTEFERRRTQLQEEQQKMLKLALITAGVAFIVGVTLNERKRIGGWMNSFGNALFGE
jgi:hypothetical protein